MTIDVATGIARILKQEGVDWVSTFPVCRVNNALGREGVPMLMMRDDRYAVAVADAFSRITAGTRIGVCTFQGGVNAAGMQYAYAGLAQAYEDGSPVLCITDGVPIGSSGNSQFDVPSSMKTVSKWFGYLDKPERVPAFMRRAFTMLRSGRPGPVILAIPDATGTYVAELHEAVCVRLDAERVDVPARQPLGVGAADQHAQDGGGLRCARTGTDRLHR